MIQDWRNRWGQGDFPFLFVQLANYKTQRVVAGAARIADRDSAAGEYRDGGDHRYRRIEGHSPEE